MKEEEEGQRDIPKEYISITEALPQSEQQLSINGEQGSFYFSPLLMVYQGRRKFKATFQIEQKIFYKHRDGLGKDNNHLNPSHWKYQNINYPSKLE